MNQSKSPEQPNKMGLPQTLSRTIRQIILPGDRVLIYDTDRFRWHQVTEVLIGTRTSIKIQGANFYFDSSLVAKHERGSNR